MNRILLSAATTLALLITGTAFAPAARADSTINTKDKDAVAEAYHKRLLPLSKVAPQWTGSTEKCKDGEPDKQPAAAVGTESAESKKATFKAINYYRAMAGLSPVKENPAASAVAMQAALMMAAKGKLSHHPSKSWPCYSARGALGAKTSNLALSWSGDGTEIPSARAIQMYMDDFGEDNASVGHRRWILFPPASEFGTGTTATTNALKVVDERQDNPRPRKRGTAWPSPGFFPWELIPTSNRWSYSLSGTFAYDLGVDDHDFTHAKVTVVHRGEVLKTKIVSRGDDAAGDPALVWEVPELATPKLGKYNAYQVTITGVTATSLDEMSQKATRALSPIQYWVKVFQAAPEFIEAPNPTISGTARVGKKLTAKTGTWKPSGTSFSYQWYRSGEKITGATASSYTLTPSDKGKKIVVKVTGSNGWHKKTRTTSKATAAVGAGSFSTSTPKISGTAKVGKKLTAKAGTWKPSGASFSYRWYRNGKKIKGATKSSYTLKAADKGKKITVKVTGATSGYKTTKASKATKKVK